MSEEENMIAAAEEAFAAAETPLDKVKESVTKRGYTGILMLGKFFRRQDDDDSGSLGAEEMVEAMREIGVDLPDEELEEVFKAYDSSGDGAINYEEFLDALRPDMSDTRREVVLQAFAKLDNSNNGVVTVDDIKQYYSAANHPSVLDGSETEEDVLTRFLSRFEGNTTQDGQVTQKEFLDYYSGISKSIDMDLYFVEVMKNTWGL